jgi:hypothetical protein
MPGESKKKRLDKLERKVLEKLVSSNIRKRDLDISEEELVFFKEYPLELERLTSTVATKKLFLTLAGVVGTILVGLSIAIRTSEIHKLLNGFITDLLFEGGIALWGAAITVYMLEIMMHRQEFVNRQYRRTVQKKIGEQNKQED